MKQSFAGATGGLFGSVKRLLGAGDKAGQAVVEDASAEDPGEPTFIAEGEKVVNALAAVGIPATTSFDRSEYPVPTARRARWSAAEQALILAVSVVDTLLLLAFFVPLFERVQNVGRTVALDGVGSAFAALDARLGVIDSVHLIVWMIAVALVGFLAAVCCEKFRPSNTRDGRSSVS